MKSILSKKLLNDFIHLRVHSQNSVNKSIIKIEDIISHAKKNNQKSAAIIDDNNLFSAIEFYEKCMINKIKPIIGSEVLIKNKINFDEPYKILLLIKNKLGYLNLLKLISKSVLYNDKDKKEFDLVWFKSSLTKGLIALSSNKDSNIGKALINDKINLAIKRAKFWKKSFNNEFYLEIQRFKENLDESYNSKIIYLSNKLNIPLVATHPVIFKKKDDFIAHEVKYCILNNKLLNSNREKLFHENQYFYSNQKMNNIFKDIPSAIINSIEISKKCNLELDLNKIKIPFYKTKKINNSKFLIKKSIIGLKKKIKENFKINYKEKYKLYKTRLINECRIIICTGFSDYFLIVYDFIKWIKKKRIPIGPGRGSGAGSLVAYALNITNLDPIKYNLLFERFLNPERISLPDFDIDICQLKREKVLKYARKKYGINFVYQIITFGKMAVKAALRDVGRILGYNYNFIDKIVKLFPYKINENIIDIVKNNLILSKKYNSEIEVRNLINLAIKIEGLVRNTGIHAGGVIISPNKIFNFCPIFIQNNNLITQYDKNSIELIGLIKFDFLALTTLSVINACIKSIKNNKRNNKKLISNISLNDELCFYNLRIANTTGVFQLESLGMKNMLIKSKINSFENIIALISLYRPGPIKLLDSFCLRKNNKETINYLHYKLKDILKETYGIIIYQEQVMLIAQIIGGYSLGKADIFRKIISKKNPYEMSKQRVFFCKGALNKGISLYKSNKIFDIIERFSGYGFNKSHAAAYSLISYHTIWLKSYYITEFMASSMSFASNDLNRLNVLIKDSIKNKIIILPVDINKSKYNFVPLNFTIKKIRYGLKVIKGLGKIAAKEIIKIRKKKPFKNFQDFCFRINKNIINYKIIENLISSGAFDSLDKNRANLINNLIFFYKKNNFITLNKILKKNKNKMFFSWNYKIKSLEEKKAFGFFLKKNIYNIFKNKINLILKNKKSLSGIIEKIDEKSFINKKFYLIILYNDKNYFQIKINEEMYFRNINILKKNELIISTNYYFENKYNKNQFLVKNILNLKEIFYKKKLNWNYFI